MGPLLLEFTAMAKRFCAPRRISEVASETGAKEGPLAITLRSCCALGFLNFNPGYLDLFKMAQWVTSHLWYLF